MTWTFYNTQGQEKRSALAMGTPSAYGRYSFVVSGTPPTTSAGWNRIPANGAAGTWTEDVESDATQFDPATGTWTCRVAGFYQWTGNIGFAVNATGARGIEIRKNAASVGQGVILPPNSTNSASAVGAGMIQLAVGDTVELYGYVNGATPNISSAYFAMALAQGVIGPQGPAGPSTPIPVVTALPGSPVNGQEVYYRNANSPWPLWHLRYDVSWADAYKWEFLGGGPLRSTVNTDETYAAGATYVDSATVGPQVTLPLSGDYTYSFTLQLYVATQTTAAAVAVGLSLAGAQPVVPDIIGAYTVSGIGASPARTGTLFAQPSGRVVKMMQNTPVAAGGTPHTRYRELQMTPVRLG